MALRELEAGQFKDFCDEVEGSSLEELTESIWPDGSHDPKTTLVPVAERHFNSAATQWGWLGELKGNIERYRWFYDRLEDQKSKNTLTSVMHYRLTWDAAHLIETQDGQKYFDWSLINRPEDATYVDAGAFDGGSVVNFVNTYGNGYNAIHAFEPFSDSFAALQESCGDYRDTSLVNKGLWDKSETLSYVGTNQSVSVASSPDETVEAGGSFETVALDDYLPEAPSLIKMDIEGAELRALKGAKRAIEAGMPALAICVYHLLDDLRTIPGAITSISDSYDLNLRNYKTRGSAEIVLYGRPQTEAR